MSQRPGACSPYTLKPLTHSGGGTVCDAPVRKITLEPFENFFVRRVGEELPPCGHV